MYIGKDDTNMSTNYVQINHDPFAREDLIRETVHLLELTGPTCAWCGGAGMHLSGDERRLFRYGIETDSGRISWQNELFCSVDCMRIYHS